MAAGAGEEAAQASMMVAAEKAAVAVVGVELGVGVLEAEALAEAAQAAVVLAVAEMVAVEWVAVG